MEKYIIINSEQNHEFFIFEVWERNPRIPKIKGDPYGRD